MSALTSSSWNLPTTAPVPQRAHRGSHWRPHDLETVAEAQHAFGIDQPGVPATRPHAPARPTFVKQMALGLGIFAGILAASVPLALISEGLALGAAAGVGAVAVALLARRLLIAPLVAALLAVLGAFATSHSVHLAYQEPAVPIRLSELAPAAGLQAGGAPPLVAMALPSRADFGSTRLPVAGWAFPAALFALWALGFGAIRANQLLVRWALRKFGPHLRNVQI